MEGCSAALVNAGFGATVAHTPDGIMVSDAPTASAFFASYIGSAAQLAWNKTNAQKTGVLDQLATLYAAKLAAGRIYSDSKTYQIDPASQANVAAIGSLAACVLSNTPGAAPWPSNFFWIAADNSQSPMTAAQMYAFAQNIAAYVSSLVTVNYSLKQAINAAETMTALQAININSGWPSNP